MEKTPGASVTTTVRPLRGVGLARLLHGLLPLGRKYHPLLALRNPSHGLVAIPFAQGHLVHPAAWRKYVAAYLLAGEQTVPEFRLLAPICRGLKRGCLVDVGANLGVYTLLLRRESALPIVAFEPQPFLFDLLEQTIAYNGLAQVEARRLACGAEPGEVPFALGINGGVAHTPAAAGGGPAPADFEQAAEMMRAAQTVVRVPVVRLDDALAGREVALLKIDCEGFEQQILAGARRLIAEQRPHLFVELHPTEIGKFGGSPEGVLAELEPHYDLEFWDFSQARHHARLVRSLLKHRHNAGLRVPDRAALLAACRTAPLPPQLYVIGTPRCR